MTSLLPSGPNGQLEHIDGIVGIPLISFVFISRHRPGGKATKRHCFRRVQITLIANPKWTAKLWGCDYSHHTLSDSIDATVLNALLDFLKSHLPHRHALNVTLPVKFRITVTSRAYSLAAVLRSRYCNPRVSGLIGGVGVDGVKAK